MLLSASRAPHYYLTTTTLLLLPTHSPPHLTFLRYIVKERIGKGSFGQVVRAWNTEQSCEVAIKIIKSKRPFLLQARTEIELLSQLRDLDPNDQHNIGASSERRETRGGPASPPPPLTPALRSAHVRPLRVPQPPVPGV